MNHIRNLTALLLIATVATICPALVSAQSDNWISVRALRPNTELIVMRKNDDKVVGYLQSANDDTIAISSDEGSFVIGKANIEKIYYAVPRDKKKSMNRGALYGMIAGLAAGVLVAVIHEPEGQETPGLPLFLAGTGGGIWLGSRHGKGRDKGDLVYSVK